MHPDELNEIQAALAGAAGPVGAPKPGEMSVLGRRNRRYEGHSKSTGRELYTDDLALPGMLHGKILRSPHPHARILSIDTSDAEAIPGVAAVITGADMPVEFGIIPWTRDEHALAVERVRYVGDAVAAVAARDEDTANRALAAIHVEYETLPALLEPRDSLNTSAVQIHEPKREGRNGNVTKHVRLEFGPVDDEMDASDVVVEGEYYFHGTTHAPIEPHCAIAHAGADGLLTIWSSTQVPHYLQRELARVLGLDVARIRVIQPAVGGAFGGKSEPFDLEFCVAALSIRTGRPVKVLYTREELFYSHRGRHPIEMWYRVGASKDGALKAVDARSLLDGGAYASFGLVTTYYSGQLLTAPYRLGSYRFESTRVYTNKPACGPKRGHGSVQPRFAFEVSLDKLATELGIDPIELRRRNFMGTGETVNEFRVRSNGFLECLDAVERASGWKQKYGRMPFGRGLGVAGSCYISGTNYPIYPNSMPQAAAQVQIERSGRVTVFHGASEIGQGSDSTMAAIAAEELGVPLGYVRVVSADTDLVPVDLGAYSSRETLMVGNATRSACRELAERVVGALATAWDLPEARIRLANGWAHELAEDGVSDGSVGDERSNGLRRIPIAEAFQLAEAAHGTLGAVGHYDTPKDVHGEYRGGTIGASPAYSFTAHVAEVEVDADTGFVDVKTIWVAHDCGKALNPMLVEGQMEGSAYMGFGEALMEHHAVKRGGPEHGLHDAPSLLDYRIPTSRDCPEFVSLVVESNDPEGPYGAKEAGEGPLHPSLPAIANAIYDAVGIRMDRLPFTPDRVWRALRTSRPSSP
ncbi:MAG: xanthine dehydrogenase family protein molybdopterin-binding subunit [marine benthic group bacterium]|jgi:4-hydroxybenzoyl-CoA reductase alpha subunit|nr:xanthine dehydrogenase family protein molybdopterin-binding subunit [Candidatus Carthagonibacter metallireducens]MCL7975083.1 xanthine dehydrogenase family protein molybdopterin-binding subunit [Gemmatimonadota bacterium]MCL7978215.1 xanthine dehydrogenase family protein molybdopterin-binding subunit [Gemmatimonadota bacterium]MCL7978902.1 xanthine dehydrogenase family protein molybdopterin-binding subunit [Gemmatimonadota bacterium]MCL7981422.1 xanthine dehydrogenase family protein molybdop